MSPSWRARRSRPLLLSAALVVAGASLLVASVGSAADRIRVAILDPGPFDPVSGEVRVRLEIDASEPIARVDVIVDGVRRAVLTSTPWEAVVGLSPENREHVFRVVAHGASGATGEMVVQTPAIEVDDVIDLPLQQLFVTVTRRGDRVTGLARDQFTVFDAGRRQELVTFEGGDAPLTAVLLVDSSESMRGERLSAAIQGARTFTAGMRELDEVMGVLFADRLLAATRFTDDPAEVEASLGAVEAAGGTALTDHLYSALKILDGRQGRRVVVVLSDGFDVYSALDMDDVLWKIRRSQAIVYWLALRDRAGSDTGLYTSAWRDAEANEHELDTLRAVVRESGGRIVEIEEVGQVERAFQSILNELRGQYVLGYYPTELERGGGWREVKVKVDGYGNKVRARKGYVDY